MKPVSFDYQRPNNICEALELLNEDHDARILAGGQSLIPMLSMRLSRPSMLIDIGHIEELAKMENTEGHIEIGAMVRQEAARTDYSIKSFLPLLAKGLKFVGHKPTRVRGTIGGSLAHADPSAEICLVAVTLGAEIVYHDFGEDLVFDASEFFIGPMLTLAPQNGCLTKIRFPKCQGVCGTGFREIAPRQSDYSIASAAAQICAEDSGVVTNVRLGIGSVGDYPELLNVAELIGTPLNDNLIKDIVESATAEIETVEDLHASAAYRKRVVTELAIRALLDARDDLQRLT